MKINLTQRATKLALLLLILCSMLVSAACRGSQTSSSDAKIKANPNAKRSLGLFSLVYGTSYLMAPIAAGDEGEYSSKGSPVSVYNYAFFNTADGSVKTLMPTNDYWITQTTSLPEKAVGNQKREPTQWFLYFLVKDDTDGDKKLTYKDNRALAVSDADGAGYTELISDVTDMFGQTLRDSNILFVIYESGSKKYAAKIDLSSKKVISTSELALEFNDLK